MTDLKADVITMNTPSREDSPSVALQRLVPVLT